MSGILGKRPKQTIAWASKVSNFMQDLYKVDPVRYERAMEGGIPFGDLSYGHALEDWHKKGCPEAAWYSTAEGEIPCPMLMAFRVEITQEFRLPILTTEEAAKAAEHFKGRVIEKKVFDWGPS